jgi:hypothetical protein
MSIGMIRSNIERLVKISVIGEVCSPIKGQTFTVTADGRPVMLPGVGGITYNVRVGDLAAGFECDHVEPGVSIENKERDERSPQGANTALNLLSCIGNEATVVSGDAKGEKGVVTGKHGGIEHVLVDFNAKTLEKMVIGDKVQVKAFGVGLKLPDFPEIIAMNLDPGLLGVMKIEPRGDKLEIAVTHIVPAAVMGSGLGASQTYTGDYDIQLFDDEMRIKYGLEDLRLGDIVAIEDADHSYGRIYKKGAMSVGIVVHTSCVISGHGPRVTTLFTSTNGKIAPKIDTRANIADILSLRKG